MMVCPQCGGNGWYPVEKPNPWTGKAELQQEECENCYGTGNKLTPPQTGEDYWTKGDYSQITHG